jgi:hypothetical protein
MPRGKQHVDLHRKLALRRALLRGCPAGAVYVPFIGDGDIAAELYADRMVYGADLDPNRSATARARLRSRRLCRSSRRDKRRSTERLTTAPSALALGWQHRKVPAND